MIYHTQGEQLFVKLLPCPTNFSAVFLGQYFSTCGPQPLWESMTLLQGSPKTIEKARLHSEVILWFGVMRNCIKRVATLGRLRTTGLAAALTRTCKACKGTMTLGLKSRLREHSMGLAPFHSTSVLFLVSLCHLKQQAPKMTKKNSIKDGTTL